MMFIMLSDVSVTGSELPLLSTASFGSTLTTAPDDASWTHGLILTAAIQAIRSQYRYGNALGYIGR